MNFCLLFFLCTSSIINLYFFGLWGFIRILLSYAFTEVINLVPGFEFGLDEQEVYPNGL